MDLTTLESAPAPRHQGVETEDSLLLPLDELLEAAAHGATIGEEQSAVLVGVDGSRLSDICSVAAQLRNQGKGTTVTFSPKVFIPLTRLCRDFCGYCTFRQDPSAAAGNLFMTPEEVLDVARAGQSLGCTEALFTLGERPEQRYPEAKDWLEHRGFSTTLEYVAHVCKLVAEETQMCPMPTPAQ